MNICVAKVMRELQIWPMKKKLCLVMILTKEQIYHHCIMKKMNFFIWHVSMIDKNGCWNVRIIGEVGISWC